ncbi:MAG: HEPN domain-containing protein [Euryarchaeota archaeon]|nr:HEPN domain-containing protein [Euryarchaeota archaeon]MDE1837819.1 HEPN domain-containing protein [Euryarchaeota archaeon]MDE1880093.1 HEPN domain-containing protein [Euryarchaeota archaeon]MDE2045069.1 HEPN domain-containing protein [Thermoplasmata archaeon]
MTRPPPRTEQVASRESTNYLSKAREFEGMARWALEDLRYSGAGLAAIHAVISACDAFTVRKLGLRNKGEDHRDVVRLMKDAPTEGLEVVTRRVLSVLDLKNRVEYGGDGLSADEAERALAQAERVLRWVEQHVGR